MGEVGIEKIQSKLALGPVRTCQAASSTGLNFPLSYVIICHAVGQTRG